MPFCQIVIGPPGSGKSTYCNGMHQFMSAIGRRCSVVNLDPANDRLGYPCALNVMDLVSLEEIMNDEGLGPNGGIIHAMETIEENLPWIEEGLQDLRDDYVLIDCPGQVELFTHHNALRNIITRIERLGYRPVVVNLVDAIHCTDPSKYIAILMLALKSMLQMDLPHINVLSKVDLLSNYGSLDFNLDFYKDVQDLDYLLPRLNSDPRLSRFGALNEAIVGIVQDFSLVSFETLAVEDKSSMTHLLRVIDRAGGYAFGSAEGAGDDIFVTAVRQGGEAKEDDQARWIDYRNEYDEIERKKWASENQDNQKR